MRAWILTGALAVAACSAQEAPPADDARQAEPAGRAETRSIRNTDAVGYSGSAVADQVDDALNASDDRGRQLQEADERSSGD